MQQVKAVGHLSEKRSIDTTFLRRQKNGLMLDFIRLLSVWSPVITIGSSEAEPVIVYYIQQTLNLTHDHSKLKEIAFAHSPKGSASKKDWLQFYKSQSACDFGQTLTPPRYNKGKEMSTKLEIINYLSTLKCLAKVQNKTMYAVSFNLSNKLLSNAQKVQDNTKSIAEKMNYRFKKEFGEIPTYFITAEYTSGDKRLHYHGTVLLDRKEKERARSCFRKVNPEARAITLVEQPDILNYWPIRWGSYITKSVSETAIRMSHPLYATKTLKAEARHHYDTLRALIVQCKQGTAPEPITPTEQINTHLAEHNT